MWLKRLIYTGGQWRYGLVTLVFDQELLVGFYGPPVVVLLLVTENWCRSQEW